MMGGLSLRSRIALFLVLPLALTIGAATVAIVVQLRGALFERLQSESEYHTDAVAQEFRHGVLERHRTLVGVIAESSDARSGDWSALAELFRRMAFALAEHAAAAFSWNPYDSLRWVDFADDPKPKQAELERALQDVAGRDSRDPRALLTCLPSAEGPRVLVAMAPYRNSEGKLLGVLGTVLSPRQLALQIAQRVGSGAAFLVDGDTGEVLASTAEDIENRALREFVRQLSPEQRNGSAELGQTPRYLVSAASVTEPNLALVMFAPKDVVFSLSSKVTEQLVILLASLAVISTIMLLLLARTVLKPLGRTRERILEHARYFLPEDTRLVLPRIRDEARQLEALFDHVADEVAQREQAVQKSEQRYRTLTETLTDAVLILDDQLQIRYSNRLFSEWSQLRPDQIEGRLLEDFAVAAEREHFRLAAKKVMATGQPLHDLDVRLDSDEARHVRLAAVPYERDEKGVRSLLVVGSDITLQKQLQAQLLQSEKMSALGQLVSGVAHELNNPLATILSSAQIATFEAENETVQESLRRVIDETRRASRIVRNLLTFARQHPLSRIPTEINAVVQQVCAMRRYDLESSGVMLTADADQQNPVVLGDRYQLEQVLLNLINNAADSIRDTGRTGGRIEIRTETHGGKVCITVDDNGPGIPTALSDRIFDPFFTTKAVGQGTGLGLSVSLAIVRDHSGTLAVALSELGGAAFGIELPLAPAGSAVATRRDSRRSAPKLPQFLGRKALVIDDEEGVRSTMATLLTRLGIEARSHGQAELALQDPELASYDLIFCDIRMPEMDGRAFHAALQEKDPQLVKRLVIVTGDAVSPPTARFLKEAGLPTLLKPFEVDDLAILLKKQL